MHLPQHARVSREAITAAAKSHGLTADSATRLPDMGIYNAIYLLGDSYVFRVPRQHPAHYTALYNESVAVPLAREAAVRTPALLVYDDSRTFLPVPYTIYERVWGETLERLELEPGNVADVWRELGCDLARLHGGVGRDGPALALAQKDALPDPRGLAEAMATGGWTTSSEARWITGWLDRLSALALTPVEHRFLHGDTQATNIMVEADSRQYRAVLDWGSAGWGDPAWDFAGVPIRAVPYLLEGYRSIRSMEGDETAEARILWRHLQLALLTAQREPQPDHSWAERPLTMLLDITRFFLARPPEIWQRLGPG